jgi:hypothetical protein
MALKRRTVSTYWYPTIRTDSCTSYDDNFSSPGQGICNLLQFLVRARTNMDGRHDFELLICTYSSSSRQFAENKGKLGMPLYTSLLSSKEFRYLHRNIVIPLYTSTTRPKHVERLQSSATHGARSKGCILQQFGGPNSSRSACERVNIRVLSSALSCCS